MKRALILIAVLAVAAAGAANAITHGQPDGERHPNVGALVGTFSSGTFPYCSGTLISPTVFLTAAHCDIGLERVRVTFDSEFTPSGTTYEGTFHGHPAFPGPSNDPKDIAVVVFDEPIAHIAPARLPGARLLDAMKSDKTLNQATTFTNVGYGGNLPEPGPGGHTIAFLDIRQFSVSSFNGLTKAWLHLSQNGATGDAGTCYGDSGGPQFLGSGAGETDVVVSITVTGDIWCKATNQTYRTDTEVARAFLAQFVTLP